MGAVKRVQRLAGLAVRPGPAEVVGHDHGPATVQVQHRDPAGKAPRPFGQRVDPPDRGPAAQQLVGPVGAWSGVSSFATFADNLSARPRGR